MLLCNGACAYRAAPEVIGPPNSVQWMERKKEKKGKKLETGKESLSSSYSSFAAIVCAERPRVLCVWRGAHFVGSCRRTEETQYQ